MDSNLQEIQLKTTISHVRQEYMAIQSNKDYQRGFAKMTESFAADFGMFSSLHRSLLNQWHYAGHHRGLSD